MLDFGDEFIVFNPLSWDAHLLNAAAAAVLDLLAEAPRSAAEVGAFLAEALQESERESASEHAAHLLEELNRLGLAQAADGDSFAHR